MGVVIVVLVMTSGLQALFVSCRGAVDPLAWLEANRGSGLSDFPTRRSRRGALLGARGHDAIFLVLLIDHDSDHEVTMTMIMTKTVIMTMTKTMIMTTMMMGGCWPCGREPSARVHTALYQAFLPLREVIETKVARLTPHIHKCL